MKAAPSPHHAEPFQWLVALGSNVGDALQTLTSARHEIHAAHEVVRASAVYLTPPMYDEDQGYFHNALLLVASELPGEEFLAYLQEVERRHGRTRHTDRRYGPRTLDLDVVGAARDAPYGVSKSQTLTLPHPRMHERRFVLQPLVDVLPQWQHPTLHQTAKDLLNKLSNDDSFELVYHPMDWI